MNLSTIIVLSIVILVCASIVASHFVQLKKGKKGCGCNCGCNCSSCCKSKNIAK